MPIFKSNCAFNAVRNVTLNAMYSWLIFPITVFAGNAVDECAHLGEKNTVMLHRKISQIIIVKPSHGIHATVIACQKDKGQWQKVFNSSAKAVAFWLKTPEKTKHRSNLWIEKYIFLITWTLNHRLKTIMYAAISIVLSFGIIPFLSTSFIPYEDYSKSLLNIELPNGSTLKQTDAMAQQVAAIFKKHPEVEYVLTSIEENNINKAYNLISTSKVRNEMIVDDVITCITRKQTPVILTRFKEHAKFLYDALKGKADHVFLLYGDNSDKENTEIRGRLKKSISIRTSPAVSPLIYVCMLYIFIFFIIQFFFIYLL